MLGCIHWDQVDPLLLEQSMPGKLNHEIASKPAGILDQHRMDSIRGTERHEIAKAISFRNRISTTHSFIVELLYDFDLVPLRVRLNCCCLSSLAVAVFQVRG